MTGAPYDSGDQVRAGDADFVARQSDSTTDERPVPDSGVYSHMAASFSGQPVVGHQHTGPGHWPPQQPFPQAYPTQQAGRRKPGLVVAGVAGLGAMVLAIGVVIGVAVRDRDSDTVPAGASATAPPGPVTYSMKAITNACDLVDRTPLTRWASAPLGDPAHEETASSGNFGILNCNINYGNSTDDTFPMNTAAVKVRADVMDGSASRTYDHWKRSAADLADEGSVVTSGEFTGIGTQGYWQFEADNFGGIVDAEYVMCVWDGGVAVRVEIDLSREKESPVVDRDELDSVARSQARKVLAGLRQN
ncbi:hypothetical protein [Nocardia gamkensis]|uniref:DUF3558 domain-containing protein n=1 Tax=Nocardia gamkensis TaxID=352869 RepID=A0A7X6R258_9NOCA|nr:hypothetical protein [Nocardia gamkensis]NKY25973.1 hypothetical protein [Nocardia gamkensis]